MTIAYRSGAASTTAGSGTLTISKPTGVVDGDVMVLFAGVDGASRSPSLPAGWTPVDAQSAAGPSSVTGIKVAASEGASYALTVAANSSGVIVAYTGVDPTAPLDVHSILRNASSTNISTTARTPTVDNCMVVWIGATAAAQDITKPGAYTARNGVKANSEGAQAAELLQTTKTVTSATGTTTSAVNNTGAIVVLTPSSAVDATATPAATAATAGTTQVIGAVAATGSATAATAALDAPTVTADAALTPNSVAASAGIPQSTATGDASPTPDSVATAVAVDSPTTTGDANTIPTAVAGAAAVPTSSVTAGASPTPDSIAATIDLSAPTVGVQTTPAAVATTATLPVPSVAVVAHATVTPAAVAVMATLPTSVAGAGAVPSTSTTGAGSRIGIAWDDPDVAWDDPRLKWGSDNLVSAGASLTPAAINALAGLPTSAVGGTAAVLAQVIAVSIGVDEPAKILVAYRGTVMIRDVGVGNIALSDSEVVTLETLDQALDVMLAEAYP